MPYPDLPASGTPVAIVQRDYSDGNGTGGAQTVELAGLDSTSAGNPQRIATLGPYLATAPLQLVSGTVVDLAVTAGTKTPGTVLGDPYELPGSYGELTPPFNSWDLLYVAAFDYSSVMDAGDLELWFFQTDPGYHDGDTFDLTHASLLTVFPCGAPVLLSQRSDAGSSRVLTPASAARRPMQLPLQTGWLVVVVRGSGFTLPATPNLAFVMQLAGIG